jgi:hypothetical protein
MRPRPPHASWQRRRSVILVRGEQKQGSERRRLIGRGGRLRERLGEGRGRRGRGWRVLKWMIRRMGVA